VAGISAAVIVLVSLDQPDNAVRWDSFTLNTSNWQSCLPGAECPGYDTGGFLTGDEIIAYFENSVERTIFLFGTA
jgi:hypothetical protein